MIVLLISTPPARLFTDFVEVEDFRHFKLRRQAVFNGPQANARREISHASVQLCQQRHGNKIKRRRVDENRLVLPLLRREADGVDQLDDLRRVGLGCVEVNRHIFNFYNFFPAQGFELFELRRG